MDDEIDQVISQNEIGVLPTFLFIANGKLVDQMSGYNPDLLKRKINNLSQISETHSKLMIGTEANSHHGLVEKLTKIEIVDQSSLTNAKLPHRPKSVLKKTSKRCESNDSKNQSLSKTRKIIPITRGKHFNKHTKVGKAIVSFGAGWSVIFYFFHIKKKVLVV